MITIEKAFKNLDKYQPFFKFQTWLSKIAKTTAIDFLRFKRTRLYSDLELSLIYHIKNIENAERKIIDSENLNELKIKINRLTQKRREIVTMRTMGLKCREIAEETNVSINTITGHLLHIKQKLAV
jgi:RNA polymerase sigma-70 factor (ECF subfamily)